MFVIANNIDDPQVEVRRAAIEALGRIGAPADRFAPRLLQMIKDPREQQVRGTLPARIAASPPTAGASCATCSPVPTHNFSRPSSSPWAVRMIRKIWRRFGRT
jgi:hypothetical protein